MNATTTRPAKESQTKAPTRLKCLIVDDDPVTLSALERTVRSCGHEAAAFDNAEAAWQACRDEFFPVVMLDWLMPGMDGLALCRHLRTLPYGDRMVILVVTGNDRPEHLEAVLAAGADDFLSKPLDIDLLKVRLAIAGERARNKHERYCAEEGRNRAAADLQETLERVEHIKREWEATADSVPQVICLLDGDGRIIRTNRTVESWGLRDLHEVKGLAIHDLFHPGCDDPACYLADLWSRARKELAQGRSFEHEVEDRRLDRYFGYRFNAIPAQEEVAEDGTSIFAAATVDDITGRKRAEIELARAHEREIETGSRIQQSLLFGNPPRNMSGVNVSATAVPSQTIAGDFYTFFEHGDTVLDLIVGDVMGKGVPAALIGAATVNRFLETVSRTAVAPSGSELPEPEEIVTRVNRLLAERFGELESFVTLCYARFDLERNRIAIVDCGHPNTLQFRSRAGDCVELEGTNMPLGFSETEEYKQVEMPIAPGDSFLFVSDGVTEAQNGAGELFGRQRLEECLRGSGKKSPDEITQAVRDEVRAFAGTDTVRDDLTCIAVAIRGGESRGEETSLFSRELELTSSLAELGKVRRFVRDACEHEAASGLDEEIVWQLELAVNEAAANVIKHAYGGRQGEWFGTAAEIRENEIAFTVKHRGKALDDRPMEDPAFDGSRDNGFGLFIIENYMDRIERFEDAAGNKCTRMVKKLGNS